MAKAVPMASVPIQVARIALSERGGRAIAVTALCALLCLSDSGVGSSYQATIASKY